MNALSDVEKLKSLLDAAERLLERIDHNGGVGPYKGGPAFVVEPFRQALRAYDPPKPKIPVLPPWEEFCKRAETKWLHDGANWQTATISGVTVHMEDYEAIRTLTSKEQ